MSKLHHCAINVSDYDWYSTFFQEIFKMKISKSSGEMPARKVWFKEGIQLNEIPEPSPYSSVYDHIALSVCNIESVVSAALKKGCTLLPDKHNWVKLPNGVLIELMAE